MRALLLLLLLPISWPLAAAVLVVDTGTDAALSDCTAAPDDCSLRGALSKANLTPASDDIHFNIPMSDPSYQAATASWRIGVGNSALPLIEAPVNIDGYTQPGASANTQTTDQGGLNSVLKIEVRRLSGNNLNGLEISLNFYAQAASSFRGLVINSFLNQIVLSGSSAHRIEGCFLGTDISGTLAASQGPVRGVISYGPGSYVIGGSTPAARNLISGMSWGYLSSTNSNGMVVQGNLIGTDISGNQPIGFSANAFETSGSLTNALIGGSDANARNVFAAASYSALALSGSSGTSYAGTRVQGNYFGVGADGRAPLGNGFNSASPTQALPTLSVFGVSCSLQIGGEAPGEANLIAYGGKEGILAAHCSGLSAPFNRYRNNRGLAFDVAPSSYGDGPTANDLGDVDEGGNRLINYPELTLPAGFVPTGGSSASVSILIDSTLASVNYPLTVRAFRADCGGGSRELVASTQIAAIDAQLPQSWLLTMADGNNLLPLTLNVIDAAGNTSEFSPMQGDHIFADAVEDVPPVLTAGNCR